MENLAKKIQEAAAKALSEGKADLVIGYRKGTTPLIAAPMFANKVDDCEKFSWSSFAKVNLANFLPKRKEKIALIAKGCDARSAIGQVSEMQIPRENLYIIGVSCQGMVDNDLITDKEKRPILEVVESAETITVKGDGFSTDFKRSEILRSNCRTCIEKTPKNADELIGPEIASSAGDNYEDLNEILAKTPEERMAYFKDLVKNCIRCYACRNACPLCYCPVCFVDETMPQWLGKSEDEMDTFVFHILRAFHCAGRCTDCGACESACPISIKVRQFTRLLEQEVNEKWGYSAGLSWDQKPPLSIFLPDDSEDFIK